ncbi:MAG: hypothetical protein ACP5KH_00815 [Thermodesulfovibrio sp.]
MRKKLIIALVALFAVVLVGTTSYAWRGGGPGYGGYGYNCPGYANVDPEKAQKFYNDTASLRQKMFQLRGEIAQLYAQPNPDWNAIGKKQQELTQLRLEMQKKAQQYGYGFGRMQGFGNCRRCW